MSQRTCIHFYTTEEPAAPAELLLKACNFLRVRGTDFTLFSGPNTDWKDHKSQTSGGPTFEILCRRMAPQEAAEAYVPKKGIFMDLFTEVTSRLKMTIWNAIPETVRRDHAPHNTTMYINPHDIYEDVETDRGRLLARAFFSVSFWGYSTPRGMAEYRRRVLAMPEFQALKELMQSIVTPLNCEIYGHL